MSKGSKSFLRRILIDASIIIGSFVVFGMVFYFMSRSLSAKADRILADRAVIASRASDLENLGQLRADAERAVELQKKIDALLPGQDGLIGFPQFLENMARVHSLGVAFSFAGSPALPAPPSPGQVAFSVSLEGPPQSIRNFMNDLELRTTRFAVNLDEVDFVSAAAGSSATLKGKVFFK